MLCPHCNKEFKPVSVRNRILDLLKNPIGVTELKKRIGCPSFGNISYHLSILEKQGLLVKLKDVSRQGQPTYYQIKKVVEDGKE